MSKFNEEDDALLSELGVEVEQKKAAKRTPKEERIIAGFEEIQRFVEEHGHPPAHGEEKDIFERLYAVRLERISWQPECRELVESMDRQGILLTPEDQEGEVSGLDDDELLEALGVESKTDDSLQNLKHVRSSSEIRAAENIGKRSACEDFDSYKHLFAEVRDKLKSKQLVTENFRKNSEVSVGEFFIIQGQIAYVQSAEPVFIDGEGREDRRLRVIFDNTTEGVMLRRSLQKRLWEDDTGRRIADPEKNIGPLFSNVADEDDLESGTLYVLRSKSSHPEISKNRDLIHKVGFTTGSVERRVADAENQATYLLAQVEIVATYKLFNISPNRLENLIHRFLEPAKLDIEIEDRFGKPFKPREWFLVPIDVIGEAMKRLQDGSIVDYVYDPAEAKIVKRGK